MKRRRFTYLLTYLFLGVVGVFSFLAPTVYGSTVLNVPFLSQLNSEFYQMRKYGCYLTSLAMAVNYVYRANLTIDRVFEANGRSPYVKGMKTIVGTFSNLLDSPVMASVEDHPEDKATIVNYELHKRFIEIDRVPVVLFYRSQPREVCNGSRRCSSHAIVLVGTTGDKWLYNSYEVDEEFYLKREKEFLSAVVGRYALHNNNYVNDYLKSYLKVVRYNLSRYTSYTNRFIIHDPAKFFNNGAFIPFRFNRYAIPYDSAYFRQWVVYFNY